MRVKALFDKNSKVKDKLSAWSVSSKERVDSRTAGRLFSCNLYNGCPILLILQRMVPFCPSLLWAIPALSAQYTAVNLPLFAHHCKQTVSMLKWSHHLPLPECIIDERTALSYVHLCHLLIPKCIMDQFGLVLHPDIWIIVPCHSQSISSIRCCWCPAVLELWNADCVNTHES